MTVPPVDSSRIGSTSNSSADVRSKDTRNLSLTELKTENLANGILTKEQLKSILNKSKVYSFLSIKFMVKTVYTKSVSKVAQAYLTTLKTGHAENIQEAAQNLSKAIKIYREKKTGKNWLGKQKTISPSDQAKLNDLDSVERHLGIIKLEGLLASNANMQAVSKQSKEIMENLLTSIPRNDQEIVKTSKEILNLLKRHNYTEKSETVKRTV